MTKAKMALRLANVLSKHLPDGKGATIVAKEIIEELGIEVVASKVSIPIPRLHKDRNKYEDFSKNHLIELISREIAKSANFEAIEIDGSDTVTHDALSMYGFVITKHKC